MSDVAPTTAPGTQAELDLAGTAYPVGLKTTDKDGRLQIDLVSHDEVFEVERYAYDEESFSLMEAAEEHYSPPLPLLSFPIHTDDPGSWSGTMTTGPIARPATAKISTSIEHTYIGGTSEDTLKVVVDLDLVADQNRAPLKRQLVFWFEKGRGLIKREFGSADVRQPPNSQ